MLNLKNPLHHLLALALAMLCIYVPSVFVAVIGAWDIEILNVRNWSEIARILWALFGVALYVVMLGSPVFKAGE